MATCVYRILPPSDPDWLVEYCPTKCLTKFNKDSDECGNSRRFDVALDQISGLEFCSSSLKFGVCSRLQKLPRKLNHLNSKKVRPDYIKI